MDIKGFFAGAGQRPGHKAPAKGPAAPPPKSAAERGLDGARERADRLARLLQQEDAARAEAREAYCPMLPGEHAARVRLSRDLAEALVTFEHFAALIWNADIEAKRKAVAEARAIEASVPRTWMGTPDEGPTLKDAEHEGRALSAREIRRDTFLARAAQEGYVGVGPSSDTRPRCHGCKEAREIWDVTKGPEGPIALCRECMVQIEYDRERRCVSCFTPTVEWCPGLVCRECHKRGVERAGNLWMLRDLRWAMNPGNKVRP